MEGFVTIKVYDILGNEVTTLVNETKPIGDFIVRFDGSAFANGTYIVTMKINDFYKTKKILLLK